jgi:hypothetical protein
LVTVVETLLKHKLRHPPISLLFAAREESGIQGCRYLDPADLNGAAVGFNGDGKLAADLITGAVFAHTITEGFREAFHKAQAEVKDADGATAEVKFEASHAYPPVQAGRRRPARAARHTGGRIHRHEANYAVVKNVRGTPSPCPECGGFLGNATSWIALNSARRLSCQPWL